MAKKMKRIGPVGWFARAFAAGFGTVAGVMFAAAIGCVMFGGLIDTNWELPAVSYPASIVPAQTYATPDVCYPAERTASATYSYPATSYPPVTPPTISAAGDERPPEPNIEVEVEYR